MTERDELLPYWWPRKMISGGQTGVDRAALEWAVWHGVPHGGWCPRGRRALDGRIPAVYQLHETDSPGYRQRTLLNVHDSDATLVLNMGVLRGGTLLTVKTAKELGRPCLVVQVEGDLDAAAKEIAAWLRANEFETLNVAGPSGQRGAGIGEAVMEVLDLCIESP